MDKDLEKIWNDFRLNMLALWHLFLNHWKQVLLGIGFTILFRLITPIPIVIVLGAAAVSSLISMIPYFRDKIKYGKNAHWVYEDWFRVFNCWVGVFIAYCILLAVKWVVIPL